MSERDWEKGLLLAGWDLRKAVELAIHIEEMGAERYRTLAKKWNGKGETLHQLFTKLASDEVAHRDGFRKLLTETRKRNVVREFDLDEECLRAIAHGYFFLEDGGPLAGVETLADREQVLGRILKFENATLHYYRGLKDVLGMSPTMDVMIAEEKRHAVAILCAIGESERSAAAGCSDGGTTGQG